MISIFPLWTFHLYVATFQQHLHMEYISLSWYDIPELVVPIRITLIDGWVTRTPLKTGGEFICFGKVSSSCSSSDTRRVNLVTKTVISHEWGKDRHMEYISLSWYDIPELVVPIRITLIEGCCKEGSYWTKGSSWLSWNHHFEGFTVASMINWNHFFCRKFRS
jgi:hypothetical protein